MLLLPLPEGVCSRLTAAHLVGDRLCLTNRHRQRAQQNYCACCRFPKGLQTLADTAELLLIRSCGNSSTNHSGNCGYLGDRDDSANNW